MSKKNLQEYQRNALISRSNSIASDIPVRSIANNLVVILGIVSVIIISVIIPPMP